jgi:hypothetical protein
MTEAVFRGRVPPSRPEKLTPEVLREVVDVYDYLVKRAIDIVYGPGFNRYVAHEDYAYLSIDDDGFATLHWVDDGDRESVTFLAALVALSDAELADVNAAAEIEERKAKARAEEERIARMDERDKAEYAALWKKFGGIPPYMF